MRKFYFLLICLFTFGFLSAQEELSKEEKERREKNIQAANPFAKFGYKAKVATLSKGKYLEVHDLDSIVTIGSARFHVDKQDIVGYIEQDTTEYAKPLGDTPSRWLSVDPLAEEFPDWSPYTFVFNNPLRYTDPDGRAPEECCDGLIRFLNKADRVADKYGQKVARFIGEMHPGVGIMNAYKGYTTGENIYGEKMGNGEVGLEIAAALPLGKVLKGAKYIDDVADVGNAVVKNADEAVDASKLGKTDFIVTPDGVAVPKNQNVMREGFDKAGFPKKGATQTSEKGVIHTVPTKNGKVDVRTMEGSSNHPKRAVINHPNTNNPKTPSGKGTVNKRDNHIEQH